MNKDLLNFITNKTLEIMQNTFSDEAIKEAFKTHLKISHVIPIRHRVLGGLYQAVNIKFGNFLEILLKEILKKDEKYTIVANITSSLPIENKDFLSKLDLKDFPIKNNVQGGGNTLFIISSRNQKLIDEYITECTKANANRENLDKNFKKLLEKIESNIKEEKQNPTIYDFVTFNNDVDLLFFKNKDNHYFYVELKKEDNHDSRKTKDMYKKVITTFACLLYQEYTNENVNFKIESLTPILLFFENIQNQSNILPISNVYSGELFFNEYLTVSFNEINTNMCRVSNSDEINSYLKNRVSYILNYSRTNLKQLLDIVICEELKISVNTKEYDNLILKCNEIIERIDKIFENRKITKADINYLHKRFSIVNEEFINKVNLGIDIYSLSEIKNTCKNIIELQEKAKKDKLEIKSEELKIKYNKDFLE